jgi:hypothetical protein
MGPRAAACRTANALAMSPAPFLGVGLDRPVIKRDTRPSVAAAGDSHASSEPELPLRHREQERLKQTECCRNTLLAKNTLSVLPNRVVACGVKELVPRPREPERYGVDDTVGRGRACDALATKKTCLAHEVNVIGDDRRVVTGNHDVIGLHITEVALVFKVE